MLKRKMRESALGLKFSRWFLPTKLFHLVSEQSGCFINKIHNNLLTGCAVATVQPEATSLAELDSESLQSRSNLNMVR